MRKFIGLGLVLGLVASMFVMDGNKEANSLTVESDFLLLNDDIAHAKNLVELEEKKEEGKAEELIWLN
tara:strand:- start:183 stop:386 length:204 start_codon:yes stop_codon:yes gene_type:complete